MTKSKKRNDSCQRDRNLKFNRKNMEIKVKQNTNI